MVWNPAEVQCTPQRQRVYQCPLRFRIWIEPLRVVPDHSILSPNKGTPFSFLSELHVYSRSQSGLPHRSLLWEIRMKRSAPVAIVV